MKYLMLFFCLLLQFNMNGQHTIKGKVIDRKTSEALSYVNIHIKGTGIGTITDRSGNFSLTIPSKYQSSEVVLSFIGYQSRVLTAKEKKQYSTIRFVEKNNLLDEVTIMPDSTLLDLLRAAYKKIPDNYPTKPSELHGFYRETHKTEFQNYLYFAEAALKVYKTGYQKRRNLGQVKIKRSVVNEFPHVDSVSSIKFYGGAFMATSADFIYRRKAFLNPKNFKDYHYTLLGTTLYNNHPVYIVSFDTKNGKLKGSHKGKLYIEKSSLAYVAYEYALTPEGLDRRNNENPIVSTFYKRNEITVSVFFEKYNDNWHLKYARNKSIATDKKHKGKIIEESEFITTQIQTENVKPIPLSEQLEYGDIFTIKAGEHYNENYWEGYNVLEQDSLLKKQIELLYTTEQSKELLTMKVTPPKQKLLVRIITRLSADIGISYLPVRSPANNFSGSYTEGSKSISFQGNNDKYDFKLGFQISYFYSLNKRWEIEGTAISSLAGDDFDADIYELGFAYNFYVNNTGKPIGVKLSANYMYANIANTFSADNEYTFNIGDKKIDASELQIGIGSRIYGIKPKIGLYYRLKGRWWLNLTGSYLIPIKKDDMFYVKEKSGFFLTRKSTKIPLTDTKVNMNTSDKIAPQSNLDIENLFVSLGFSLKF